MRPSIEIEFEQQEHQEAGNLCRTSHSDVVRGGAITSIEHK